MNIKELALHSNLHQSDVLRPVLLTNVRDLADTYGGQILTLNGLFDWGFAPVPVSNLADTYAMLSRDGAPHREGARDHTTFERLQFTCSKLGLGSNPL